MKHLFIPAVVVGSVFMAVTAWAHETPNLEHTHAFQKTAYGTYRQGHYVNGPQGSIIIWSPRPYTGFQDAPRVRFARPQQIARPPGSPNWRRSQSGPGVWQNAPAVTCRTQGCTQQK